MTPTRDHTAQHFSVQHLVFRLKKRECGDSVTFWGGFATLRGAGELIGVKSGF
jgi:hypothetical protein